MNCKKQLLFLVTASFLASCGTSVPKVASASNQTDLTKVQVPSEFSQETLKTWSHKGLSNSLPGLDVEKAYELLKNKKGKKVIVGVVDSGVDIHHEDLKNVLWINKNEIPNNGIDDDKNGYIDDVYGWNFLGNINQETMEITRIVRENNPLNPDFQKAKIKYDEEYEKALQEKKYFDQINQLFTASDGVIKDILKKEKYSISDLETIEPVNDFVKENVVLMTMMLSQFESSEELKAELKEGAKHFDTKLNYQLNLDFNPRKTILKDNENDFSVTAYGDNNVIGPDLEGALHGTHVAGIIAAERGNGKGVDGVANNVEIMAVRAVPDGDEYDKDVALAIRYAVDNGAKVINTSFGKGFSPHKEKVYEAIKYAASKDVLIVNAAGNDSKNIDTEETFPNDEVNGSEISDNFLTVGALNYEFNENLLADFSNYGKRNVDVFAPGVKIYATAPNNSYKFLDGTSMASPGVAGVAALIRSYFPNLTASQVKKVLMQSGLKPSFDVYYGEGQETETEEPNRAKAPLSKISTTGSIVNAYNAILLAIKMSGSTN